jgi:hypothetical protein
MFGPRQTSVPTSSPVKHTVTISSSTPASSLTWTHCGAPLHRHTCHARQHAASTLQCPLVRPNLRSRGLPPSSRHTLDLGDQLDETHL